MVDRAVGTFGGIIYLVNNAAIYGGMKLDLLLTVPLDYYKKEIHERQPRRRAGVYPRGVQALAKQGGGDCRQSSTATFSFYGLAKVGVS